MPRCGETGKAGIRRRMEPPHRHSVAEISQKLGIQVITLYKWRKAWRLQGEQRQPLLRVIVEYCEIPAGLPEASFPGR